MLFLGIEKKVSPWVEIRLAYGVGGDLCVYYTGVVVQKGTLLQLGGLSLSLRVAKRLPWFGSAEQNPEFLPAL